MVPELAKKLAEKTRDDYDALADAMDVTRHEVWDELADLVPVFKHGDHVLDIGCGNGRMVQALTGAIPGRRVSIRQYIGLDASPELVKRAKLRYPQADFRVGDALALPFVDASFNHIFMIAVLHQIPGAKERAQALSEAYRVLKPGGTMLITVWRLWQKKYFKLIVQSTVQKLFGQHPMDFGDLLIPWKDKGVKRYYHAFRPSTMRRILREAGFIIERESRGWNYSYVVRKPD